MSIALFLIFLIIFILKNNNNPYKTSENNWKILSKNIIFSSCQTSFSIFFILNNKKLLLKTVCQTLLMFFINLIILF